METTKQQPTVTELLKAWKISINELRLQANLSFSYVNEYVNDPSNWRGSPTAEAAILDGIETLIEQRKAARESNTTRLNQLLNSSLDKNVA